MKTTSPTPAAMRLLAAIFEAAEGPHGYALLAPTPEQRKTLEACISAKPDPLIERAASTDLAGRVQLALTPAGMDALGLSPQQRPKTFTFASRSNAHHDPDWTEGDELAVQLARYTIRRKPSGEPEAIIVESDAADATPDAWSHQRLSPAGDGFNISGRTGSARVPHLQAAIEYAAKEHREHRTRLRRLAAIAGRVPGLARGFAGRATGHEISLSADALADFAIAAMDGSLARALEAVDMAAAGPNWRAASRALAPACRRPGGDYEADFAIAAMEGSLDVPTPTRDPAGNLPGPSAEQQCAASRLADAHPCEDFGPRPGARCLPCGHGAPCTIGLAADTIIGRLVRAGITRIEEADAEVVFAADIGATVVTEGTTHA